MRMCAILFAFHFVSFHSEGLCVFFLHHFRTHVIYWTKKKRERRTSSTWQAWWEEVSGNDLAQLGAHIVSTQTGWHTYFFFFRPFRIIAAAVIHFVWRIFWVSSFFSSAFILLIIVMAMRHTIRFFFLIYLNLAKKTRFAPMNLSIFRSFFNPFLSLCFIDSFIVHFEEQKKIAEEQIQLKFALLLPFVFCSIESSSATSSPSSLSEQIQKNTEIFERFHVAAYGAPQSIKRKTK